VNNYIGLKWFKCDFHLHTTSSECFEEKMVTAKDWVEEAIKKDLDCIAITDHNSGVSIDEIKKEAEDKSLVIFPAVEITCDTSKIHLLILFDVDKSSEDVNDFLIKCDIDRSKFGKQDAYTSKSVLEVAKIADLNGCLIIPAHIDEFNGLGTLSSDILKEFLNLPYINAVQFVHEKFLESNLVIHENEELKEYFDKYYNSDIDYTKIKEWYKPINKAKELKKALLTFSDNPHSDKSSHHGLWGIGNMYSWIKMEQKPSLESLRQSFLLPELRVRHCYHNENIPYTLPSLWIKSIIINETEITQKGTPLELSFSPQLTTIIGGRGSGKSSILRFLRGALLKTIDSTLESIKDDQDDFYKKKDRNGNGVLTSDTTLEIHFIRNEIEYKIKASNTTVNQKVEIFKLNNDDSWEIIEDDGFIEFFEFEHYSQKQIYEIAKKPNSLRERIDNAIDEIDSLKKERDTLKNEYKTQSSYIRTIQGEILGKGKLETEVKDILVQIEIYNKSNISDLIKKRSKFIENKKLIVEFEKDLETKENSIKEFIDSLNIPILDIDSFEEEYHISFSEYYSSISDKYDEVKNKYLAIVDDLKNSKIQFMKKVKDSEWNKEFAINNEEFEEEKEKLKELGLSDLDNFERLIQSKEEKENKLGLMIKKEESLREEISKKEEIHKKYISKLEQITDLRKYFVSTILKDEKVKIIINDFRNKEDFENTLRKIIDRDTGFYEDIDNLKNQCFNGIVKNKMENFRNLILKIREKEEGLNVTGHFKNLINGLTDADIDELMLFMPEDEIEVKYKPTPTGGFKSLSTASAGQKTTAILTFILSYGNTPIILDQPEDDLDNRLVYDLIVHKLKQAKENRQIIIVTHNANIPVNGDSEYIISMDSESRFLKVLNVGSVDKSEIKKEICDVMEGSEMAFNMRSKRYKEIKK
jgi:energy-coupling factor transporter ATP-binding protein EcfA2